MNGPPPRDTPPPRPRTARVLDALRGGHSHYPTDAALADAIEGLLPGARRMVSAEVDFTVRFARWAAQQGISRLVYGGSASYMPGRNLHDAAQAADPSARVIYVNRARAMHEDAAALFGPLPGCQAAYGDSMHLLGIPEVAAMVAEGEPVAVVMPLVLSFVPDGEAARLAGSLAAGLPAGSAVALSVILPAAGPGGDALAAAAAPALLPRRPRETVAGWLDGMDLTAPVDDVRLVPGRGWPACPLPRWAGGQVVGAVARVR